VQGKQAGGKNKYGETLATRGEAVPPVAAKNLEEVVGSVGGTEVVAAPAFEEKVQSQIEM
jgi:hypothetical protein